VGCGFHGEGFFLAPNYLFADFLLHCFFWRAWMDFPSLAASSKRRMRSSIADIVNLLQLKKITQDEKEHVFFSNNASKSIVKYNIKGQHNHEQP
jgi:hypothetical protein